MDVKGLKLRRDMVDQGQVNGHLKLLAPDMPSGISRILYYFDLRFACSQVDLTCDKPISCSQMTLNGKFYIKLGVGESQNRFAG